MKILILGIGQSMRGDDAAGLEAVQLWRNKHPDTAAQVHVNISETSGLELLNLLEGMDSAILVDAIQSSGSPGTVVCLDPGDLSSFTLDSRSAHGWGVAETLTLGRSLYPSLAKCRVNLIGVVGKDFRQGKGLSSEIRIAMIEVADLIERQIQSEISL